MKLFKELFQVVKSDCMTLIILIMICFHSQYKTPWVFAILYAVMNILERRLPKTITYTQSDNLDDLGRHKVIINAPKGYTLSATLNQDGTVSTMTLNSEGPNFFGFMKEVDNATTKDQMDQS